MADTSLSRPDSDIDTGRAARDGCGCPDYFVAEGLECRHFDGEVVALRRARISRQWLVCGPTQEGQKHDVDSASLGSYRGHCDCRRFSDKEAAQAEFRRREAELLGREVPA